MRSPATQSPASSTILTGPIDTRHHRANTESTPLGSKHERLIPVDALRGSIIVLMALDHANYFVAQQHPAGEHWGGPLPHYSNALAFVTRLVTHPVAPGFFFLMGVGMILFTLSRREQGWRDGEISHLFLLRGSLLVGLRLLVVNRAWQMGPAPFPRIYLGVLFALGGCMILGSFLLHLPAPMLLVLTGALLLGTELSHPEPNRWGLIFDQPLALMFSYSGGDLRLWSNYPILPWLELVTFGMVFGHWLRADAGRAYRRALALGLVGLIFFVALRWLDGFGNIRPQAGSRWVDFLNTVKYPPSLTFTLMTMAANLIVFWALSRMATVRSRLLWPLLALGRAPLFCYLVHLFLYALMAELLAPGGTTIAAIYPYWLLGLLLLLPAAHWLGRFKRRQHVGSLVRFL